MAADIELSSFERNQFYRDNYRRVIKGLLLLALVGAGLVVLLAYINFTRPDTRYYATMDNGQVIPLSPLSEPMVTTSYILQWSSLATRAAYNLDFVNYQTQLQSASAYFTDTGWNAFMNAMTSAGVIDSLQSNKLILSAVVTRPPIVIDRAIINGRYTWNVQVPLLVTYSSASENSKQNLLVNMTIQRVSSLTTAQGIQINSFNVSSPVQ